MESIGVPVIKHLFSALVAMLVSFFFSTSALAQDAANSVLTPVYGVGVAEVDATRAAADVCRRWQACEAENMDCDIVVQASSSNNEPVVRSRGTSFELVDEAALALARQSNFMQQIARSCSAASSGLDVKVGPTWPRKQPQLGYRYAWASVQPAVDPAVLAAHAAAIAPPPTACNDGEDNDGDGKIDMDDLGCENPQDDNEWNAKPIPTGDARWANLVPVIINEASTPCPVTVTGWWQLAERSNGGDGEYHFHYKVDYGFCPNSCRTSDVSSNPGHQMTSPKGTAMAAATHQSVLTVTQSGASGTLTWTELRTHTEAPERASGIEYVDHNGTEDTTMWFGRAAEITDRGDLIIVDFKSTCEDLIDAELAQEYSYLDFVVAGSSIVGASFFGTGHSIPSAATGSLVAEFGLEGNTIRPNLAFLGTIGVGGLFDANCDQPVGMLAQLRLAAVTHRSGPVGLFVGTRIQGAWAVNDTLVTDTPDDSDTTEIEWNGHYERQLGPDAFLGWVDIGPRVAFSPRGVHSGWVLPTLSAGPGLRSVNQDLVLSGQVGFQLAAGGTF